MSSLQQLLDTGLYVTDKGRFADSKKYFDTSIVDLHNYIDTYEKIFGHLKESKINFLEIGICRGGSIKLWRDYFTNATIFGTDIVYSPSAKETLKNENVTILIGDSANKNSDVLTKHFENESFDIIIDDGNHSFEYQLLTLQNFFPKLKKGGIYVIEDVEDRTIKNNMMLNQFKMFKDFEIIDLRNKDKRDDSVLFIFRK
jgi:cephalosporin hydroxylase